MKTVPVISKVMTTFPHSIGSDLPLKKGLEMMREYGIRHLPVQRGGHLIGVLTDRDVKLGASFSGAESLTVEDVMTPDPYTVDPDAALDEVSQVMAEKKYGCALVVQSNGKLVGIFTATDGLRVLAEVLDKNYAHKN